MTRFAGDSHQVTQCTLRLEEERDGQVHRVYVPVVCYGRTAERAADLSPGDLIGVQGKLVYRRRGPEHQGEQTTGGLTVLASTVVCLVPAPVAV